MIISRIKASLPWFVFVIVGFGAMSYGAIWAMNRQMDSYINELAQSKVSSLVHLIDGDLKAWRTSIELLSTNPIIRRGQTREALAYLKERQRLLQDFDFIFIGDIKGDYTTTQDKTGNISDRTYFQMVMQGETVISDPVISKTTGNPQIVIAAPITDANGGVTGILAGTITLARLTETVNSEKLGESGYAFMLDSNGVVVAHPNNDYFLTRRLLDESETPLRGFLGSMMAGQDGTGQYAGDGQNMVMAYAPLNTVPWSVAITAPEQELYLDINLLWAVGAGIILMGFGFLMLIMYRTLQEGEHRFREVLDSINAGVVMYSPELRVQYANPPILQLLASDDGRAKNIFNDDSTWFNAESQALNSEDFPARRVLSSGQAIHGEVVGIRNGIRDGVVWFLIDCLPITDDNGRLRQIVMTMVNITARKNLEEELHYYSTTDVLTGANNRRSGLHILDKMLEICKRKGLHLVLCYYDLNDLKMVNDQFGHAEGDNYLRMVTAVVTESIRSADTLVRMGGDEFLIILPECDLEHARIVMDRVQHKLDEANSSNKYPFRAAVSYGLAECQSGQACSCEDIINQADNDMYRNKSSARPGSPAS